MQTQRLRADTRPFLLECVGDSCVQGQLPPLPPRLAEAHLAQPRPHRVDRLLVRRLLRRRELDSEALPQHLRSPQQLRRLIRALREDEYGCPPLAAVADHVLELELGQPAECVAQELERALRLLLRQGGEALVDERQRHALAVLERLEERVRLLAQLRGLRVLAPLERDSAEVADRQGVATAVVRLLVELGRALGELHRPLLIAALGRDRPEREERAGGSGRVAQLLREREALLEQRSGPLIVALAGREASRRMERAGPELRGCAAPDRERLLEPASTLCEVAADPPVLPEPGRQAEGKTGLTELRSEEHTSELQSRQY